MASSLRDFTRWMRRPAWRRQLTMRTPATRKERGTRRIPVLQRRGGMGPAGKGRALLCFRRSCAGAGRELRHRQLHPRCTLVPGDRGRRGWHGATFVFLYAADLAVWLWQIFARGVPARPYNVGSSEEISIAELAGRVANVLCPEKPVRIALCAPPGASPQRYVPDTRRAEEELDLRAVVKLDDAIERTARWHGWVPGGPVERSAPSGRR